MVIKLLTCGLPAASLDFAPQTRAHCIVRTWSGGAVQLPVSLLVFHNRQTYSCRVCQTAGVFILNENDCYNRNKHVWRALIMFIYLTKYIHYIQAANLPTWWIMHLHTLIYFIQTCHLWRHISIIEKRMWKKFFSKREKLGSKMHGLLKTWPQDSPLVSIKCDNGAAADFERLACWDC